MILLDTNVVSEAAKPEPNPAVHALLDMFEGRILPFDTKAARCYADLAVRARATGTGFPTTDGYIAAIATANAFTIASRDTSAFSAANLPVIDPWTTAV